MDIVSTASTQFQNIINQIVQKITTKIAQNPIMAVIIVICAMIVAFSEKKLITALLLLVLLTILGVSLL